jgi:pimeloyl-ACP methyl ester carboxylesterase
MRWPPDIFKGAAAHPQLWAELRQVIGRHSWAEIADSSMHGLSDYPQPTQDLRRIRAATLVLVGEDDMEAFRRCAELIRRGIPDCRRVYLPHTGHLGLLEAAPTVYPLIEAHFRAHGQPVSQRAAERE